MRPPSPRTIVLGAPLLFALGCVVGPDYQRPPVTAPAAFTAADDGRLDQATAPEAAWWRSLEDPVLTELVERARRENLDLDESEARVRAARALLGLERRELWPSAAATAAAEATEIAETSDVYYSAALDASWELDLFGRIRRSIEARAASYEATLNESRAVFVAVASEIGRTYLELRGLEARSTVAEANIVNQEESLDIVEALRQAGRATDLELAQARARLESTRATLPELEAEAAVARHRLAVLAGEEPNALDELLTATRALPPVPDRIAIGDPAALLRRRPDVAAAERRLAAATAGIGVVTADLFPRISLTAAFSSLATSLGDLDDSAARTTSFGPFLRWAAFDLGRVRDRIEAAEAGTDAALAVYRSTVLRALEETENALVRLDRNRRRQVHLRLAEAAAKEALELARVRYEAGLTSFLTVLDAEEVQLASQDALVRGATEIGTAFVALYEALGGAWQEASAAPGGDADDPDP